MFVEDAICAIHDVAAVELSPNNADVQTVSTFDPDSYRVYNRHLSGVYNPDDRHDPKVSLLETRRIAGVTTYTSGDFAWPFGTQNIRLRGVFGYTDPDPETDHVLMGHTPDDLIYVIATLMSRYAEDPTFSNLGTHKPGLVRTYKTRDQMISFYNASGNVSYSGGFTGDATLDEIINKYRGPVKLSYPERTEVLRRSIL
jgi:hypothetical protein